MSLALDQIEVGRLAILQMRPWEFVERRVESLELKDDRHYQVTVRQQLKIPYHASSRSEGSDKHDLLIPLGQFSKARRPDMEVTGPSGEILPVLDRDERGRIIAILFTTGWQKEFFSGRPDRKKAIDEVAAIWDVLQFQAEQIAKNDRDDAYAAITELRHILRKVSRHPTGPNAEAERNFIDRVLKAPEFWEELEALAETTIRIARLRGTPGETHTVSITYTERFRYAAVATGAVRRGLSWLGLDGIPVYRHVANIGQSRSLWVTHSVPDGLEPLRYFWEDERDEDRRHDVGVIESDRAVIGRRTDGARLMLDRGTLLDFQIEPSPSLLAAVGLAAALWLIAIYIYQRVPGQTEKTLLTSLATAIAGVPATLAGALAYRGETFIRRASRGPRILLALLAAQASLLAVVLGLKTGRGHAFLEGTAYSLSVYSLFVLGIFGYIAVGPRWRKSDRTRWKARTRGLSPEGCRERQMWAALCFCAVWIFIVVVFARCIYVLHHENQSVFTSDFPGNIWHALSSWFG